MKTRRFFIAFFSSLIMLSLIGSIFQNLPIFKAYILISTLCSIAFGFMAAQYGWKFLLDKALHIINPNCDVPPENRIRIPWKMKDRKTIVERLSKDISDYYVSAVTTDNLPLFVSKWDDMMYTLSLLSQFEKRYRFKRLPSQVIDELQENFQSKLRDAIERAESEAISEIIGIYKNVGWKQKKRYNEFFSAIYIVKSRFSNETQAFADESLSNVKRTLNRKQDDFQEQLEPISEITQQEKSEINSMDIIDNMDGQQFEYYCAGLLKKNGFSQVEVTKASGDQGVDILATKDDIRYAIQCKCYSSDLGNKPVQEVHAGKAVYRCQIGVVLTNRYFTQSAKDAAEATGVLLWNRDKLQQLISKTIT